MRRAARTDANQNDIVAALRAIGCKVAITSAVGSGFTDLVCSRGGVARLVEIKDGSKPPSERRLTPEQVTFHAEWAGQPVHVVESVAEALALFGVHA